MSQDKSSAKVSQHVRPCGVEEYVIRKESGHSPRLPHEQGPGSEKERSNHHAEWAALGDGSVPFVRLAQSSGQRVKHGEILKETTVSVKDPGWHASTFQVGVRDLAFDLVEKLPDVGSAPADGGAREEAVLEDKREAHPRVLSSHMGDSCKDLWQSP